MKVRIKFRKYGALRFIGHLDVMRYFQKVMRRAQIPIAFTSGYSPHMIMSFASPLGIGLTSDGEYFDIELSESISSEEAVRRMNAVSAEGIEVVSFRQIAEEKKMTGMAIVAAADYLVGMHRKGEPQCTQTASCHFGACGTDGMYPAKYAAKIADFLSQPRIMVMKQTKRSEQETDIRPHIYRMEAGDEGIYLLLAAGSVQNLKPGLVMSAFCEFAGIDSESIRFTWRRLEMYAENLITLEDLGKDIESRENHD